MSVGLCGRMDNYASELHHGSVEVFGRINSGGATPDTASGPNAAKVAIPQMRVAIVSATPARRALPHQTRARPAIAIEPAMVFVTISQKTTPQRAAIPRDMYEPCGYMIATEPSAT